MKNSTATKKAMKYAEAGYLINHEIISRSFLYTSEKFILKRFHFTIISNNDKLKFSIITVVKKDKINIFSVSVDEKIS